jgi:RimJ/RimL family protein N-acetyltransferase
MKTHYVPAINGSRVVPFVAEAWLSLMAEGLWSRREVLISGELECVFADIPKREGPRKIVGCLTYHIDDGRAIVNIAYVSPEHRGKGVYNRLHEAFKIKARQSEASVAINICHANNEPIKAACQRLGYSLHTQEWRLRL